VLRWSVVFSSLREDGLRYKHGIEVIRYSESERKRALKCSGGFLIVWSIEGKRKGIIYYY
jgi:hypothetical protein